MIEDFERHGQAACLVGHAAASLHLPGRVGRARKGRPPPRNLPEGLGLQAEPVDIAFGTRSLLASSVHSSDERQWLCEQVLKGAVRKLKFTPKEEPEHFWPLASSVWMRKVSGKTCFP